MTPCRLGVHLERARDHARDRELAQRARLRLAAEPRAQLVVVEQTVQGCGERERVTGRHREPGDAIGVRVRDAGGQVGGYHRRPRGVRLDLHETKGLAASNAWQAEHVSGVVPGGELVVTLRGEEGHACGDAASGGELAQLALVRAAADQHEVRVRLSYGPHEHVDALVVHESADEEHDLAPGVGDAQLRSAPQDGGRGREALRGQAEGHHAAPLRARGEERRVPDHVRRRCHDEVDSIEKSFKEGAVGGQQALLAHDVAVVEHDAGHVRARLQKRELAPRVRRVQVEDVGRLLAVWPPAAHLVAQSAGQACGHRRRRQRQLPREAPDVDAADGLLDALVALVAHESAHVRAGVLHEALRKGAHDRLHTTQVRRRVVLVHHRDAKWAVRHLHRALFSHDSTRCTALGQPGCGAVE